MDFNGRVVDEETAQKKNEFSRLFPTIRHARSRLAKTFLPCVPIFFSRELRYAAICDNVFMTKEMFINSKHVRRTLEKENRQSL